MSLLTLAEVVAGPSQPDAYGQNNQSTPVSPATNWVVVKDEGDLDAVDNSGNTIVDPNTSIVTSKRLLVGGVGTGVRLRVNYKAGTLTACTIQVFGFDDAGVPERLFSNEATPLHELPFVRDATNDINDGTNAYTASVEVDCKGAKWVAFGVKVAAAGTNAATSTLEARII